MGQMKSWNWLYFYLVSSLVIYSTWYCKNVHIFIFCQITSREDILEITQARFWELVPGQVVGSLSLAVVLTMSSIISNIVMHLQ